MNRLIFVSFIILMLSFGYWCNDLYKNERAKLTYFNPKYVKDVVVFTARKSRRDPYLTNMTGTSLVPFGNNVSFAVTLSMKSGGDFRLVVKACENRTKWINEFVKLYSNVSLDRCPIPPNRYSYYNMDLPPKNIPIPLADGDYRIRYELLITSTKELIGQVESLLHFDHNAKKRTEKKG